MKTWHYERAFCVLYLTAVVLISGGEPIEWLGAAAVVWTFAHMSVADRLAEVHKYQDEEYDHSLDMGGFSRVECWHKLSRYLVLKEVCWLAYFVWHGSWAAVAGVPLFLGYPLWRKFYRRRKPLYRRRG